MNKIKLLYCVLALSAAFSLTSCSDDDVVTTPLDSPTATETGQTVSSLEFSWKEVSGATQYAYELYNTNDDLVYGDVTTANAIKFTGLTPSTNYTLKVWAYGAIGSDKSTSPTYVLSARTADVVPLATPVPTAEASGPNIIISWPAVQNAASYTYSYYPIGNESQVVSRSTRSNSVTLTGLSTGDYSFSVTAISNQEAYSNSEVATITFTRQRQELWRVTGTFHSAYYASYNMSADWDVEMVHYDDGSYSLLNWMFGGEGYDLIFTVNDDSSISLANATGSWGSYQTVLYYPGYYMYYYPDGAYSSFTGNSTAGSLYIYEYYGYDTFTWGATAETATFTVTVTDSSGSTLFPAFKQTATKLGDTEYLFSDFLNGGSAIKVSTDSNGKLHLYTEDGEDFNYYPAYYDQWLQGPYYFSDDKNDSSFVYGFYAYVDGYSDWSVNCSSWWTGSAGFYLNCNFYYDSTWKKSGYGYIYFNIDE